jgi:hypothetical protein
VPDLVSIQVRLPDWVHRWQPIPTAAAWSFQAAATTAGCYCIRLCSCCCCGTISSTCTPLVAAPTMLAVRGVQDSLSQLHMVVQHDFANEPGCSGAHLHAVCVSCGWTQVQKECRLEEGSKLEVCNATAQLRCHTSAGYFKQGINHCRYLTLV